MISWLKSLQLPTPTLIGFRHVFKRPYGWEEVPMFNARMNQTIGHGCTWNGGDVPYSELENVLHREVSSAVAIYFFGPQKTNYICGLIDQTVIDFTQLACPRTSRY